MKLTEPVTSEAGAEVGDGHVAPVRENQPREGGAITDRDDRGAGNDEGVLDVPRGVGRGIDDEALAARYDQP